MYEFKEIISRLFIEEETEAQIPIFNIHNQFTPDQHDEISIAKTANAAFIILLAGEHNSFFIAAQKYLKDLKNKEEWSDLIEFYLNGLHLINREVIKTIKNDITFSKKINDLYSEFTKNTELDNYYDFIDKVWDVFFPEGKSLLNPENRPQKVEELREKRKISITQLNSTPISDPAAEILFTSNILLTVPLDSMEIEKLNIKNSLKAKLKEILKEEQLYWYDHPIPVGITPAKNEVIYGLAGLSEMLEYEICHGNAEKDTPIHCVLSASVTHSGLHKIAKEYLRDELDRTNTNKHLNLYLFTEDDTAKLVNDILYPIAKKYMNVETSELELLKIIIGVDGEYGRHFSFLKAIAAFWHIFVESNIRATFKIDLDQVFPQKQLFEQTGVSVFEHFKTPLWGALGTDSQGNKVKLGMIGGTVVNESDINKSIFYPDVCFPQSKNLGPDQIVFYSRLPQALSTEAEMIPPKNRINQPDYASSRIHVLGGMSGILVDSLRKYRPFTPTFIGRAEDQAYSLSALFGKQPYLRCLHKPGLIMRHDKKAFVGEVLEASEIAKMIGDYTRILLYSNYAKALPFGFDKIKEQVAPFTGCFISHIPLTVIYLRFSLKAAAFFDSSDTNQKHKGLEFLMSGSQRLSKLIRQISENPNLIKKRYQQERKAWDLFYSILDIAEQKLKSGDSFTKEIKERTLTLVAECKI